MQKAPRGRKSGSDPNSLVPINPGNKLIKQLNGGYNEVLQETKQFGQVESCSKDNMLLERQNITLDNNMKSTMQDVENDTLVVDDLIKPEMALSSGRVPSTDLNMPSGNSDDMIVDGGRIQISPPEKSEKEKKR
ncbi:hypothetical protein ACH5RR_006291 [Cinchona calisaya]|uniref:Uncharacterized protein n=1 Tax=Cinchona calisaya TaxID=153742 RepID=A0ABD3ANK6_9GENT